MEKKAGGSITNKSNLYTSEQIERRWQRRE